MANYFRIKEITAPATVLRQGNLLNVELGDFIYPDEVDTLVCTAAIVYWNDNTGEHFIKEPTAAAAPTATVVIEPEPVKETVEAPPAPLEPASKTPTK